MEGQAIETEFGKNRVQYHDDFEEWLYYESPNFVTYWYGKGRYIGQAAVQIAEQDFLEIQDLLEHRINDKIEIIVYTDITDLKQSNIGTEDAFVNTDGQTKIVENKVFVFFNGDHNHLRKQIREGISTVYINSMLFGSNIQEIVQNAVLMNLPEWFKLGLSAYVGEEWNTDLDDKLRDIVSSNEELDFDELIYMSPQLAGHAMWYYLRQNFGKSTISNLLYLTRINRSVESGFLYVLGNTFEATTADCISFYQDRYQNENGSFVNYPDSNVVKLRNKKKLPLTEITISPDGKYMTYAQNEIGKVKVYKQDLQTGKRSLLFKYGYRNPIQATDYNYPILAWNPNAKQLAIIYERRDVVKLRILDVENGDYEEEEMAPHFDRILDADYVNGVDLALSAVSGGYSDIYLYKTNNRSSTRLTKDYHDDLDVASAKLYGKKGILFSSNRNSIELLPEKLDTLLPIGNFDIYFLTLGDTIELHRVTNSIKTNERHPEAVDSTYYTYISNSNGIHNLHYGQLEEKFQFNERVFDLKDGDQFTMHADSTYLGKVDTSLVDSIYLRAVYHIVGLNHSATNYNRNIISLDLPSRSSKGLIHTKMHGEHMVYTYSPRPNQVNKVGQSAYNLELQGVAEQIVPKVDGETNIIVIDEPEDTPVDTSKTIDIDNYLFQSEFDDEEVKEIIDQESNPDSEEDTALPDPESVQTEVSDGVHKFRPARIIPYRLKFKTDFFTTRLDNGLLFGGLDTYAGNRQEYNYPPPGILVKTNFKDLMEDYQVELGMRIPTTFNGAEYFITYDDRKKRIDKRFAMYRSSFRDAQPGVSFEQVRTRTKSFIALNQLRYPLDIFRSIRATTTFRIDQFVRLATDDLSLAEPNVRQQRLGLRLEYVFDNSLDIDINIKNGTRYKVFAEAAKKLNIDFYDGFTADFDQGFLFVLGADARHYQRLLKHSVIALRFAAATSFGSERILYFIGGVENWLFPRFNQEIPFPQADDFAFQTLGSNMRGFNQNIRNGSSVALFNAELRVPIFKYMKKRIRSSFIRNFQVTGFFDLGTAWEGSTPFSNENPLNTIFLSNPSVDAKVTYYRDPLVAGYGFGFRTTIFGYFVRADYAWGIETRKVQAPKFYLSLGYDF